MRWHHSFRGGAVLLWALVGMEVSSHLELLLYQLFPALNHAALTEKSLIVFLAILAGGALAGLIGCYFYDRKVRVLREDSCREEDHRKADWMKGLQYLFLFLTIALFGVLDVWMMFRAET